MEKHLCDYGCGKIAFYQLKNGKWCCEKSWQSCEYSRKTKCNAGKHPSKETIEKYRKTRKGEQNGMYGKHHSEETKNKIRSDHTGKTWEGIFGKEKAKILKERQRFRMLNGQALMMNTPERIEQIRKYMLNGGAIKALKGVKNPSKPEIMLREIVQILYPRCEFQHPVFNYALDIALLNEKIAIEYDGYYHFDCKENIKYQKERQEKIEKEGWKFLRYTMFDKFPTLEKVKEDIENLKNNKRTNNK